MADIVIVVRIADLPEAYTPAERSVCAWCAAPVWLGYAVRVDAPFATPVCIPCALPTLDPGQALTITPEVRREVNDYLQKRCLD